MSDLFLTTAVPHGTQCGSVHSSGPQCIVSGTWAVATVLYLNPSPALTPVHIRSDVKRIVYVRASLNAQAPLPHASLWLRLGLGCARPVGLDLLRIRARRKVDRMGLIRHSAVRQCYPQTTA